MQIKRKIAAGFAAAMLLFTAVSVSSCQLITEAETVNYNLAKEADKFNVMRRITVMNMRSDKVILSMEGFISIDNNSHNELVVTAKVGEGKYFKDYIYLNDWTNYLVEQIEPNEIDPYHYKIDIYPEKVIPDVDVHFSWEE